MFVFFKLSGRIERNLKGIRKSILKSSAVLVCLLTSLIVVFTVNNTRPQALQIAPTVTPAESSDVEATDQPQYDFVESDAENDTDGDSSIDEEDIPAATPVYLETISASSEEQLLSAVQAAKTVIIECDIQLTLGPLVFDKNTAVYGGGFSITQAVPNERVIEVTPGVSVALTGLKISGGNVRGFGSESTYGFGGGIMNHGNLSLRNVSVGSNSAYEGAGIYNAYGAVLHLIDSTVSDNASEGFGGGISNNGIIEIDNSVISFNKAHSGGGIFNFREARLTARDAKFISNESLGAYYGGGAVFNGGSLWLNKSLVSGNRSASDGGGILSYGQLTLESCMLRENSASKNGGGIFTGSLNNVNIMLCSVIENQANMGGGIFNDYTKTVNLNNCTIAKNKSKLGAGMFNCGETSMVYCTVAFNQAAVNAGGIYNQSKTFNSHNSIIAYNETVSKSSNARNSKVVYKNDDISSASGYVVGENNVSAYAFSGKNNILYRYSELNSIFETNSKSLFSSELTLSGDLYAYLPLSSKSAALNAAREIDSIDMDQLGKSRGSSPSAGAVQANGKPLDVTDIALTFPMEGQTVIGDPVTVSMSVLSNKGSSPKGLLTLYVNGRPRKVKYVSAAHQLCQVKIPNLGVGYHKFHAEFIPAGNYMYTSTDNVSYMVQKAGVILSDKLDVPEGNGGALLEYSAKLLPASLKTQVPSGIITLSYGSRNIELPLDETGSARAKLHRSDVVKNQNQIVVTYEGDKYFLPIQSVASFTDSSSVSSEVSKLDSSVKDKSNTKDL